MLIRFAIALSALVLLIPLLKFKLPKTGKPMLYAATTGLVLLGAYQIFLSAGAANECHAGGSWQP
nr:hypothetical protein GCM10020185_11810 [Pseudomonas brassicacearum subsp. brassicacearum]